MLTSFSRLFVKQFKKSSEKVKNSFNSRFQLFVNDKNNPILNNHHLSGKLNGCWSINVTGDWRAVYSIEDNIHIFQMIGTHGQLYG